MRRTRFVRGVSLLGMAALLVAACSGGASPSPSTASVPPTSPPSSTEPSAEPTPTELPGTKEFTIGFTSAGLSSAPFLAAIDALNKNGYTIDIQILDQSELVTEGVSSGDFAFGSGANNSSMAAVEKGANLKVVTARVNNEWTLYARTDITDCAGLGGKRLAIHSQGAVSTAMVKNYVETTCSGTEPNYVVIEGSNNRVAAMLADQIDASPLELSDSITIEAQAADKYHLISSFAEDLPDLQTTSIYVNGDFAEENPGSVLALVKAVLTVHRQIESDGADYLKSLAEEFVGDAINPDTIDEAAAKYVELGMFPTDGGLTEENLAFTAEFFGPDGTGSTESLLEVDQFADLSFLQMALDELGG
jgi:ABC-type nitrate/sulfonate/bicarbonate transport system substrate-binding protein